MVTSELKETGSESYKYLEERGFQAKGTVDAKTMGERMSGLFKEEQGGQRGQKAGAKSR